jgi:hypothetical protein
MPNTTFFHNGVDGQSFCHTTMPRNWRFAKGISGSYKEGTSPTIKMIYVDPHVDASTGYLEVNNVLVDCCLKTSECRKGTIRYGMQSDRSAAALYFDVILDQSTNNVFEQAHIWLTFGSQDQSSKVVVTDDFGPKQLDVETHRQEYERVRNAAPNVAATFPGGSVNLSGVGDITNTKFTRKRSWKFHGIRRPDENGQYRTIGWHWDGVGLSYDDPTPKVLKCCVILLCDEQPLQIQLSIDTRLKSAQGRRRFYFIRSRSRSVIEAPRVVEPKEFNPPPPDLDTLKLTIHHDMLRADQQDADAPETSTGASITARPSRPSNSAAVPTTPAAQAPEPLPATPTVLQSLASLSMTSLSTPPSPAAVMTPQEPSPQPLDLDLAAFARLLPVIMSLNQSFQMALPSGTTS